MRRRLILLIMCLCLSSLYDLTAQAPSHLQVYKNSCDAGNEWSGWVALSQPFLYYDFSSPFTMAEVRVTDLPYGGSYDQSFTFNNGNFCNQWPYTLATGHYTWCVRVYYYAMPPGAWTWTSATWGSDFYVDVTAPNSPVVTDNDCGGSHTSWPAWINHTSPYFTWDNPGDAGSGVSYYQVSVNGGDWSNVSTLWHPTYEGSTIFNFRSVDGAGNASASYVLYVRTDDTAPPSPSVQEMHCLPHGVWTSHTSPSFIWMPVFDSGELTGDGSGINRYEVSVNSGGWNTVSPGWHPTYGTGQYTFSFRTVDNVGLASGTDVVAGVYIDDSPPDAPLVTENHCGGSTSENPPWTTHTSPYFTWGIPDDDGSGILPTGFRVSVNSGEWVSVVSGWHPVYTNGSYTFDFQSIDRVGHTSSSYRLYVRIHESVKIFVKQNATGSNNGSSWTDAYTDLQSALSAAIEGDTIWVAGASYKPSVDKTGNSSPADPRTKTFKLVSNVPVYGGFAGTESKLKDRDPEGYETVLSGDIGTPDDNTDNCYSVVWSGNYSSLDGFTVTGGNGNGTVSGETDLGGGLANKSVSNVKIRNCTFRNNFSYQVGGAVSYFCGDSIIYSNCRFIDNTSSNGGGIGNWDTKAYITNCIFTGNYASSATSWGSAIFNWGGGSTSLITNCTIYNNSTSNSGGAVSSRGVVSTVTNCILWGNNSDDIVGTNGGGSTVTYSCIEQSGYAGINGNISDNPQFLDAGNNDLHLTISSPCIDAGNGDISPAFDLDGNARFDHPDFTNTGTGEPDYSDMGAFECLLTTSSDSHKSDILILYPNPNSGIFTVKGKDIFLIEVFNMSGVQVLRTENDISGEINLGNQPKGIYLVKIRTADGIMIEKVVVK